MQSERCKRRGLLSFGRASMSSSATGRASLPFLATTRLTPSQWAVSPAMLALQSSSFGRSCNCLRQSGHTPNHAVNSDAPVKVFVHVSITGGAPVTLARWASGECNVRIRPVAIHRICAKPAFALSEATVQLRSTWVRDLSRASEFRSRALRPRYASSHPPPRPPTALACRPAGKFEEPDFLSVGDAHDPFPHHQPGRDNP